MKEFRTKAISLDPMIRNLSRAQSAGIVLRAFQRRTGDDHEDLLCDLLANLMHWCDQNSQGFEVELRRARSHYLCEVAGEL